MAVLITTTIPAPRALVEEVSAEVNAGANAPDGLIVHVMSESPDGILITDIWESVEAHDRFGAERLGPAMAKVMQAHGVPMNGPPPETTVVEVFDLVRGS